ncbi:hypothetical protein PsYK624_115670 [Phanerochaete sordida]|uniref:DUF6535 domain-containing protein n=1 Tax=Phanerochaete sordida TaxID=48140 RepID=A0A9P3LHU9_9APHY|nr:hypothetical protein PsYK624_115670 [Phanerochaete sordida]
MSNPSRAQDPAAADTGPPGRNEDNVKSPPPDPTHGRPDPTLPQSSSSPRADPMPQMAAQPQMDSRAEAEQSNKQSGRSSAWQELRDTVRKIDERKVKDAKEDLDNLLVFAGLFSAVVTTFVVDSYASLQPDNTDKIVFLMQHSLAQNYTYADGILRPVSPFPSLPSFETPLWALRVNGLWFASLVVSLSTASFGLLVKQWLTEYLAMDWITPEEQLRVRQFRYPGLVNWKVYELAAALPLLLHISLGLFFLGLCFYTAAASEIIGQSTFPLVAGWAFFALFAIFAPCISSHCPYKITLLKTVLRFIRQLIGLRIRRLLQTIVLSSVVLPSWIAHHIAHLYMGTSLSLWAAANHMKDKSRTKYFILQGSYMIYGIFRELPCILRGILQAGKYQEEENAAISGSRNPARLLVSIDKVLVNDGPILQSMAEVLQQGNSGPDSIISFVIGCINNRRSKRSGEIIGRTQIIKDCFPFFMVSSKAQIILVELLSKTLSTYLAHNLPPTGELELQKSDLWMMNAAVLIIFSSTNFNNSEYKLSCTLYSNPNHFASLLQMAHGIMSRWDVSDTTFLIETAFVPPDARMWTHSIWDYLPRLNNSPLSNVQTSTIQLLLLCSWCKPQYEASSISVPNSIIMLLFVLDCSAPALDQSEDDLSLYYFFSGDQPSESHVKKELTRLRTDYKYFASPLAAAVCNSSKLVAQALNLYRVYVSQSLQDLRPLWKVLCALDDNILQQAILHPVMADLWTFLVECARRNTLDTLHTESFVKLCIVQAHLGMPSALNLGKSSSDWDLLLPILKYAAGEGTLVKEDTAEDPDDTIPKLASRALQSLEQHTLLHPEHVHAPLNDVLSELASMESLLPARRAASPSPSPSEHRSRLWRIIPPVFSSWRRRPAESSGVTRPTDVEEGLPASANEPQPAPTTTDLEHIPVSAAPPSTAAAPATERLSKPSPSTVYPPRLPPSAAPSVVADSTRPPDAGGAEDTAVGDGSAALHAQSAHAPATRPADALAPDSIDRPAHRATHSENRSVQARETSVSSEERAEERYPGPDPGAPTPGESSSDVDEAHAQARTSESEGATRSQPGTTDKPRSSTPDQNKVTVPLPGSHSAPGTSTKRVDEVPTEGAAEKMPPAFAEAIDPAHARPTPPGSAETTEPRSAGCPSALQSITQVGGRIDETRPSAQPQSREDEIVVSLADSIAPGENGRVESSEAHVRSRSLMIAGSADGAGDQSRDDAQILHPRSNSASATGDE